jgi:branched-chain amino acid transport system permease protein
MSNPLAAVTFPLFEQLLVSGIINGSVYALIGVSFGIIYSTTRIFHLAHAAVYAVAAYMAVVGVDDLGLPLAVAVPFGIVCGAALGLAIEAFPVLGYRALRKSGASLLGLFLVSLGVATATPNLLQIIFGPGNRPLKGFDQATHAIDKANFTNLDIIRTAIAWALIVALYLFLKRTKYGRAITAVRTNPTMATAVGISPSRIYMLVFAIGSALVGVASTFFAMGNVASPQMGLTPVLIGFIAVFFGGIGSTAGAALGGFAVGMIGNLSGLWLSSNYQLAIVFSVLFIILIVRPQGLLGKVAA